MPLHGRLFTSFSCEYICFCQEIPENEIVTYAKKKVFSLDDFITVLMFSFRNDANIQQVSFLTRDFNFTLLFYIFAGASGWNDGDLSRLVKSQAYNDGGKSGHFSFPLHV